MDAARGCHTECVVSQKRETNIACYGLYVESRKNGRDELNCKAKIELQM